MRTKELADRAGVNSETLRYYERRGLLSEPPRTPGGYREYPASTVDLLLFIKRAQELGFTLDEVDELLRLDAGGPESCDATRGLAEQRRADLQRRISDLQRMHDSLTALVDTCEHQASAHLGHHQDELWKQQYAVSRRSGRRGPAATSARSDGCPGDTKDRPTS